MFVCRVQRRAAAKRLLSLRVSSTRALVQQDVSVLFTDSSDKRFSPFHPTETTFRSDAMPRSPKQTSPRQDFHTSNSSPFSPPPYCLFMRKKDHGRTITMRKQRIADELTTEIPSCRVITVSYFPGYLVRHFHGTFIISVCIPIPRASDACVNSCTCVRACTLSRSYRVLNL